MPELEMCPHCGIALVDCEYHGPKAKSLPEVTSSDKTYEAVDRILAANGLGVGADGEFFSNRPPPPTERSIGERVAEVRADMARVEAQQTRPEHVEPETGARYRWANDEVLLRYDATCPDCRSNFVVCRSTDGLMRCRCMKCQPR